MDKNCAYRLEISVNNLEFVEVCHPRCGLGELKTSSWWVKRIAGNNGCLTKRRRFAFGLDLVYCVTFPLDIHSVRMLKLHWTASTDTPNKGRMFSWDRCFQAIVSRHND